MIKKSHLFASLFFFATLTLPTQAGNDTCKPSHVPCHGHCCCGPHMACYLGPATMRESRDNWHANYMHSAYGQPIALVVPPTAYLQTDWSWGAPSTRLHRVDHQFGRDYPGPGPFGGGPFRRTPAWPSDTAQFGVYSVRGPWYPTQR